MCLLQQVRALKLDNTVGHLKGQLISHSYRTRHVRALLSNTSPCQLLSLLLLLFFMKTYGRCLVSS